MATALTMIKRAMRLAGVTGQDQSVPTDTEAADGLVALNSMLDSWQIERLFVYQIAPGSYTWPAATASRTIGSGGNFSTTRPDRIESAYVVDSSSNWYPLQILVLRAEYDSIVIKTTPSTLAQYLFYDSAYPLASIYLWPVPSAELTLKLNTWQVLQTFDTLTEALALPPGYERAITYSLAVEFGPEFGAKVPDDVKAVGMQAKAAIKNLNAPQMIAQVDYGVVAAGGTSWRGRWNIYADR